MLLAKPRSKAEVVNDANGTLVALYRNIQWHLPALVDEIRWALHARQNIRDFLAQPGLTEIQRVGRWFVCNLISFGAQGRNYGFSKTSAAAGSSRRFIIRKFIEFRKRMAPVHIENVDYRRFLDTYDAPATFFFLDPPYLDCAKTAYDGWNRDQMIEFRDRVFKLKGTWIVTLDDSKFNRELFAGCQIDAAVSKNQIVNNRLNSDLTFGEIIIRPKGQLPLQVS